MRRAIVHRAKLPPILGCPLMRLQPASCLGPRFSAYHRHPRLVSATTCSTRLLNSQQSPTCFCCLTPRNALLLVGMKEDKFASLLRRKAFYACLTEGDGRRRMLLLLVTIVCSFVLCNSFARSLGSCRCVIAVRDRLRTASKYSPLKHHDLLFKTKLL